MTAIPPTRPGAGPIPPDQDRWLRRRISRTRSAAAVDRHPGRWRNRPVDRVTLLAAAVLVAAVYSIGDTLITVALTKPDVTEVTVTGCLTGPVIVVPAEVTIDSADRLVDSITEAGGDRWCPGLGPRAVRVGDLP